MTSSRRHRHRRERNYARYGYLRNPNYEPYYNENNGTYYYNDYLNNYYNPYDDRCSYGYNLYDRYRYRYGYGYGLNYYKTGICTDYSQRGRCFVDNYCRNMNYVYYYRNRYYD